MPHHADDSWMPHLWHSTNFWIFLVIIVGFLIWKLATKNNKKGD